MILFLEDWERFPSAIVHKETRNESFLRYAALLKSMGVKNHLFCLQLHDPELVNVDPFDPNLSQEMMLRIALECHRNFWYYIREVARSPDGDPDSPIRFKAHRGNMALYWLYWCHVTVILIQIRQTGKSFAVDNLDTYLMNIRRKININLLTKDDTLRAANLERLKKIEMELPFYLKQRTRNDVGNTEQMKISALGNVYTGHLPNKSEKMALNVGRGLTSANFRVDELAFFFNIAISLPAALAAGTAARNIARDKGEPYGIIMTTTAGKKDDRDGAYAYNEMMQSAVWSEMFMDARNEADLHNIVRKASPKGELQVNCTFNHRQLGFTDEWLRDAIRTSKATGDAAERDFLNHWTSGSILAPLSTELNNLIRESVKSDYYTQITRPFAYVMRWYVPEARIAYEMSQNAIASIDTSDAVGQDDIGLTIRSIRTGAIIGAGNFNETNLIMFAEWLCVLLETNPNLTMIIERRSSGATIIDYLLLMLPKRGIDPFKRLYNKVVQEADEKPEAFKAIQLPMHMRPENIYVAHKAAFGFATSGSGITSRSELYSTTLQNAAKNTGQLCHDKVLIDQILSLEIRNGRIDHAPGGHDDLVISWLLSYWLMTMGKNLNFYGINSRDILCDNVVHRQDNNPIARYAQMEQMYLREQIEKLVEEIKIIRDDFLAERYEAKLQALVSKLSVESRQTFSIDGLIHELREQRKINKRMRH